ncbi:MAG: FAD/NAD(P)-binding protein [Myxococcota bacterium]
MSLDWLIVGGGIHGVHIAACLIGEGETTHERLRIVDPARQLLARWRACTATTGMTHLRSPSVHHLDLDAWSLQRFAGKRRNRKRGLFAPPYERPSLALFNAHCDRVVESFKLGELHIQDRAETCTVDCDGVTVQTTDGRTLTAQNVVLAIGASEQPYWPVWAPQSHPCVRHIFEPSFDGWPSQDGETVAIVGGGLSAAQVALRLSKEHHRVHLISRHALRQHQFDSDPGWLGKHMFRFSQERSFDRRRAMISDARHRGSVPPDIRNALRRAINKGRITWHETEIEDAVVGRDGLRLCLAHADDLDVDRVLLATGFASERPGGAMVDELIASASLPCARCGYPIVDAALRWHSRIVVSGPLAELELGPISRNIAGARRAGARLITALRNG